MGPCQRYPLLMEAARLLEGGRRLAQQDGITREAKNKIHPAVRGDHVHDLGRSKMTVAADQDGPPAANGGKFTVRLLDSRSPSLCLIPSPR